MERWGDKFNDYLAQSSITGDLMENTKKRMELLEKDEAAKLIPKGYSYAGDEPFESPLAPDQQMGKDLSGFFSTFKTLDKLNRDMFDKTLETKIPEKPIDAQMATYLNRFGAPKTDFGFGPGTKVAEDVSKAFEKNSSINKLGNYADNVQHMKPSVFGGVFSFSEGLSDLESQLFSVNNNIASVASNLSSGVTTPTQIGKEISRMSYALEKPAPLSTTEPTTLRATVDSLTTTIQNNISLNGIMTMSMDPIIDTITIKVLAKLDKALVAKSEEPTDRKPPSSV